MSATEQQVRMAAQLYQARETVRRPLDAGIPAATQAPTTGEQQG